MLFFSSRRRHTSFDCDWSSDVCSSDLAELPAEGARFTDGTAARFDEIILATGFGAALGPLGGLVQVDAKGFARRRDRVVSVDQPGLYVVGQIGRASCRERV